MAAPNFFRTFGKSCYEKKHDLSADTFKVVLSNVAPVASNDQLSDITQIANGNGYTTGGSAAGVVSSSQTNGVYKWVLSDVTFTASVGSMAAFRYAILYNDTSTNDLLICWYDYGSPITLTIGLSHLVDFDSVNGVFDDANE